MASTLLLLLAQGYHAEQVCVSGKKVTLSLDYSTNATGHPKINARLEQPMESAGWQLDVEMGTSACGPGGVQRKTLALTLNGSPSEGLAAPSPGRAQAPRNYVTLPGLGHYRAPSVALDWLAARDLCRTERAQLAVPASQREVEVVLAHFSLNASGATHLEYVWHGTNDFAQEGKWVTDDDVVLENTGFSKFHSGQPDGGNGENCLVLVKSSKQLADAPCSWKLPYICKADL
ncbi:hypothetical protein R5R35_000185 [Gryllus longicercus]|uniref:C-type lectin domain-containing protein n=1 Tax=Gryllus longicercus TaxID=2509291 RepID=A0AAN9VXK1_9ORTH